MGPMSVAVLFGVMYVVAALMYRSAKAGWRPTHRPGELTDILLWREQAVDNQVLQNTGFTVPPPTRHCGHRLN